jgi:hypothetical protein
MNSASVHITKLSAAKRQLQAAIRMHFQPEDELAVHTVGSAVYRKSLLIGSSSATHPALSF